MKSQSLADRNMGGCSVVSIRKPSPSPSVQTCMQIPLSLDLFSSAGCMDISKWIHGKANAAHGHEHPNRISCLCLLEVSRVTHISLPLAYESVMALSSAGHSPQGKGAIPWVHPQGSPSKKASKQWLPFLQPVCKGVKIHTYSSRTNTEESTWPWMRDLCLLLQWDTCRVLMCQISLWIMVT